MTPIRVVLFVLSAYTCAMVLWLVYTKPPF
jgi:hypothetical protein